MTGSGAVRTWSLVVGVAVASMLLGAACGSSSQRSGATSAATSTQRATTTSGPAPLGLVGRAVIDRMGERFDADLDQRDCLRDELADVEDVESLDPDDLEDLARALDAVVGCVDLDQVGAAAAEDLGGDTTRLDEEHLDCLAEELVADPDLHATSMVGRDGTVRGEEGAAAMIGLLRACALEEVLLVDGLAAEFAGVLDRERVACLVDEALEDVDLFLALLESSDGFVGSDPDAFRRMVRLLTRCDAIGPMFEVVGGFGPGTAVTDEQAECFTTAIARSDRMVHEAISGDRTPAGAVEAFGAMADCDLGALFAAQATDDVELDASEATCLLQQMATIDVGPPGPAAEGRFFDGIRAAYAACDVVPPPGLG